MTPGIYQVKSYVELVVVTESTISLTFGLKPIEPTPLLLIVFNLVICQVKLGVDSVTALSYNWIWTQLMPAVSVLMDWKHQSNYAVKTGLIGYHQTFYTGRSD